MEIKSYLQIMARKWWIVSPIFLITMVTATVLTLIQTPVFEATATYAVRPSSSAWEERNMASGLEILSRRSEIATTYAEVANSHLVKKLAAEALKLAPEQRTGLSVESRLRAGTNVLEVTVRGPNPVLVRDFANEVGAQTLAYVQDLYEIYDLKPLDEATIPAFPVRPRMMLNIGFGAALGLALGAGLGFLSAYMDPPKRQMTQLDIIDSASGAYNERYLRQRLQQEISRAKRNSYPLSIASMDVDCLGITSSSPARIRHEALRKVAWLLRQNLRPEDIMARPTGTIFTFLLPDLPGAEAKQVMERLQARIALTPLEVGDEGINLNLVSATGVVVYQHNGSSQNELLDEAMHILEEAKSSECGQVLLQPEESHSST